MSMKSALREYLPAVRVILSRRRRILVRGTFDTSGGKYQSAGRSPFGDHVSVEYHYGMSPHAPLRHFVALSSTGKHVTEFSGRYRSPTNPVPLPPSRGRKTLRAYHLCHLCCITESQSLLPLEDDSPAEDFQVGLIFEYSLHTKRAP